MGCCTARCTLMTICALQMIASIERFVFDLVGFMWTPVLVGVIDIIIILFCMFGIHQYRPKFIYVYGIWHIIWLGWNIFIICLYLNVGALSVQQSSSILSMGTTSKSWWLSHGFGCVVNSTTTKTFQPESITRTKQLSVTGCVLDGIYTEVIHAGVQILFSIFGIIGAILVNLKFAEEEDSFDFIGGFDSNYSSYNSHAQQKEPNVPLQPIYIHRGIH
ncbi:sodium/potassium-transporting ATPase subunit beta-1-interacting protein 3-like isoform X1 [Asterias rubens]|uniref:sodium/potassium-transporting ATPase subunit beta-1-interacting protein 3-like isoform X1 n=1 Tax=Asterias rubens TaxID=7604 RepID=UPI001455C9BA|nr:sodium/potassium-transporting ATPase subunit beta-1-interacting protein 3-like isoform X1 [Asterias rubens]